MRPLPVQSEYQRVMVLEKEPILHTKITDILPEDHPHAFEYIECILCKALLHRNNNRCMRAWVETGRGNFCLNCFTAFDETEGIDESFAIRELK